MAYSLDRNKGKVSDIKNNIDIKQGELKNLLLKKTLKTVKINTNYSFLRLLPLIPLLLLFQK